MNESLEGLKKRLYKKGESFSERERGDLDFDTKKEEITQYWQQTSLKKTISSNIMKKIFYFLLVVFVVLVGVVLFFLFSGGTTVSSQNINIEIRAPVYVEGGKPSGFKFFIENKNTASLEMVNLIIDFPDSVFTEEGFSLSRKRFNIGEIKSAEIINESMNLVFMGTENEDKTIKVSLEYRLAESSAIFEKKKDYTIKLSSSPLGVTMSIPEKINSNQEFTIETKIVSISDFATKNLYLQMEYPAGYQFVSATPEPSKGDNTWSLGDIASSQEKKITIKGIVEGQDLDEKNFIALVGSLKKDESIASYGGAEESVIVKKSALDLLVFVQGEDTENNIIDPRKSVRVDLQWVNNLSYPIRDAELTLEIRGNGYDEQSISYSRGSYRSFDKKIIWNTSTLSDLGIINPGEDGNARASFSILNSFPVNTQSDKNFDVTLNAKITGLGTSEQFENVEIIGTASKTIKVASDIQLVAQALHYSGEFENGGSMPPKVGQETTYTIVWSLGNTINDFSGVEVSAVLPSYVRWMDTILPEDSRLKFDEKTGVITWEAGNVLAGTGIIFPAKKVSFQVALDPSPNQIGSTPSLIGKTTLNARDSFVNEALEKEISSLNTSLKNDPDFKREEGGVIE